MKTITWVPLQFSFYKILLWLEKVDGDFLFIAIVFLYWRLLVFSNFLLSFPGKKSYLWSVYYGCNYYTFTRCKTIIRFSFTGLLCRILYSILLRIRYKNVIDIFSDLLQFYLFGARVVSIEVLSRVYSLCSYSVNENNYLSLLG